MIRGEQLNINNVYMSGSRKSGKTRAYENFVVSALIIPNLKIDSYLVRNKVKDAQELFLELSNLCRELNIANILINKSTRTIQYQKNTIRVLALETNIKTEGKNTANLGLATGLNKDYTVVVFEEISEITFDKVNAIKEAVRGYKQQLFIYATNPWSILHWYIERLNNIMTYNEHLLTTKHQQFKVKNKDIIHYTTYILNPFISQGERDQMIELLKYDPVRARVSVLGMPGIAQGAVYAGYFEAIPDIKELGNWLYKTDYFTGGVDWGERRDTTAAQLWAIGFNSSFGLALDEYTHSNKDNPRFKTNREMVSDIIDFYLEWGNKIPKMRRGTMIQVDYAATAIIELLNAEAQYRGVRWLTFQDCIKYEISQRIDHLTLAMRLKKIYFNFKYLPNLCRELQTSQYDDNGKRIDKDNDSIDCMEYAVSFIMYNLTRDFNLAIR